VARTALSLIPKQQLPNLDQHCKLPSFARRCGHAIQEEDGMPTTTRSGGSKRGFAAMDPAKQREIASKGGKASHGGGRKSSASR
jgi:general stress protein YciG